jgi:hypothetical protein
MTCAPQWFIFSLLMNAVNGLCSVSRPTCFLVCVVIESDFLVQLLIHSQPKHSKSYRMVVSIAFYRTRSFFVSIRTESWHQTLKVQSSF